MNKVVAFLKKTLKVTLWVIICYVLLLIVIAMLSQIPAIQTKVVNYATSFISNKTYTKVNIKKVNISFPKSMVIKGIYLEDRKKDTLLFARKAKINIAFKGLFNNKLHINSFVLEEAKLNVNRIGTGSLFNYNFLFTAFGDTTSQKIVETKKKPKWTFGINHVNLKNIQLHYHDDFGGIKADVALTHLKLNMDKPGLAQSFYKIDELLIESLNAHVLIKSKKTQKKKPGGILPVFTIKKIQINNTNL